MAESALEPNMILLRMDLIKDTRENCRRYIMETSVNVINNKYDPIVEMVAKVTFVLNMPTVPPACLPRPRERRDDADIIRIISAAANMRFL